MMKFINTICATSVSLLMLSIVGKAIAKEEESFYNYIFSQCGAHFVGEMTYPTSGQDSFAGKKLMARFAECDDNEVRVPFIVGEDKSRTWIFTKTSDGLRLKHDHRHADGTPDEISNYGGDADNSGSEFKQSFPADAFTQKLIPEASTNVWTISFSNDGQTLTYHLERHSKPRFTAVLKRVNDEE